jgi:glycosyltransferase involved in cell wall biosynthesis
MKILAVQPYGDGAGHFAKYTLKVCEQIAQAGHDVTLVVNWIDVATYLPEGPSFKIVALGPGYQFFRYEEQRSRSAVRWMGGRMRLNVAVLRRAACLLREQHFDVVQWFSYEMVSSWIASRLWWPRASPPVAIEIAAANFDPAKHFGSFPERAWRQLMRRAAQSLLRWPVRGSNVNSTSHVDALRRQLGLSDAYPIEVVADTREIPNVRPSQTEARARIGLADYTGSVFLFFGTLRRDKGIETLAAAIRRLDGLDFRVVIAGMPLDWDFPGEHSRLLEDPRVVATRDYVAEGAVDDYFFAADALLLPYPGFYAGSSGPMYDACARSLPVIASDVSEMGHFVRAHENGMLVPPDAPDALADAMRTFAAFDGAGRERLRQNALTVARSVTRATVATRFCALYSRLVGAPPATT